MSTSLVGIRLREERERIGITQADAGLFAGVTREQWGRYERGALPNADALLKLQGHGFDVNYILGGSRMLTDATLSAEERQLLGNFRSTDDDGRASLLRAGQMEALRVQAVGRGVYAPAPPSRPVQLHESPPGTKKKPPA